MRVSGSKKWSRVTSTWTATGSVPAHRHPLRAGDEHGARATRRSAGPRRSRICELGTDPRRPGRRAPHRLRGQHVRRPDRQGAGVYGPLQFAKKQLSGGLRIMTWAHFVPDWTMARRDVRRGPGARTTTWRSRSTASTTPCSTDGRLGGRGAERSRPFWSVSPPSSLQKQASPAVTDLVQEHVEGGRAVCAGSRGGRRTTRRRSSSTASRVAMRPTRCSTGASFLQQVGVSLGTWDDLRQGAAKLKQVGDPVGSACGTSRLEHLLTSLLYCYGSFIQEEGNRIVIGQGAKEGHDRGPAGDEETSPRTEMWTRSSPGLPRRTTGLPRRAAIGGARTRSRSPAPRRLGEHGTVRRRLVNVDPPWARMCLGNEDVMGVLHHLEGRGERGGGADYLI